MFLEWENKCKILDRDNYILQVHVYKAGKCKILDREYYICQFNIQITDKCKNLCIFTLCECIGLCVYSYLYVRNQLVYFYNADIGGMIILKAKSCQSKLLHPENDLGVYFLCVSENSYILSIQKHVKVRFLIEKRTLGKFLERKNKCKILDRDNYICQVHVRFSIEIITFFLCVPRRVYASKHSKEKS